MGVKGVCYAVNKKVRCKNRMVLKSRVKRMSYLRITQRPVPGFCDQPGQQYVLTRDLHTFGLPREKKNGLT